MNQNHTVIVNAKAVLARLVQVINTRNEGKRDATSARFRGGLLVEKAVERIELGLKECEGLCALRPAFAEGYISQFGQTVAEIYSDVLKEPPTDPTPPSHTQTSIPGTN